MELQDSIKLLLSMQEHPEDYTDEQIAGIISGHPELAEMMEQLSLVKRAVIKQEAEKEPLPMDDLWQQFSTAHASELEQLGRTVSKKTKKTFAISSQVRKIAAVFIGIIITAGIALAAVHVVRNISKKQQNHLDRTVVIPKTKNNSQTEVGQQEIADIETIPSLQPQNGISPTDTIKTDSVRHNQPTVFDNVSLEKMFQEIAAHYHMDVEFKNDDQRQLRFYFVWNPDEPLDSVVKRFDRFESIDVKLNDNKITVK